MNLISRRRNATQAGEISLAHKGVLSWSNTVAQLCCGTFRAIHNLLWLLDKRLRLRYVWPSWRWLGRRPPTLVSGAQSVWRHYGALMSLWSNRARHHGSTPPPWALLPPRTAWAKVAIHVYSVLQSKWLLPRSLRALSQWTQGKEMEMIEKRQNRADW